jgi:hypothetical protein
MSDSSEGSQAGTGTPFEPRGIEHAAAILLCNPGNVVELRGIMPVGAGKDAIESGYFDDGTKLVAAAQQLDGRASGVFVTLNVVNPALLARANNRLVRGPKHATADGDILRRRLLLIDIDAVRPSGISASDSEKSAAVTLGEGIKTFLRARGFPVPLEADSGNGHHLLYAIDLPSDDGGLVERALQALAFRFDTDDAKVDTSVHNPARLTKLYGTMVRKGDSTPERPHRRSRIIRAPERLEAVGEDGLRAVAALLPSEPPRSTQQGVGGHEATDIDAILARAGVGVARRGEWKGGTRWVFEVCPFNSEHTDRSAYLVQFASGAVVAGCHHNGCQGKGWRDLLAILDPQGQWRGTRSGSASAGCGAGAPAAGKKSRRIISAYKPFPTHLLPGALREFTECASTSIGCDPAVVALPALAAAASAIGNTRRIQLKPGWSEPSILWTAIVAESGRLKSPAFTLVQAAIDELQRQYLDRHALDIAAYDEELKRYEVRYREWAKAHGEGALPIKPEVPVAQRLYTSDPTMEALAVLLQGRWRGLLLMRDELSGWLASFDQYRSGPGSDVAYWLEIHGGRSILVDRKTGSQKFIYVPRASVSIAGCIQPGVLANSLGTQHFQNGLAARFLLACPPRNLRRWTDACIPPATQVALGQLLERLYSLAETTGRTGEKAPLEIDLTPAAKWLFVGFFNEHGDEQAGMTGDLAAAWAKLEGYAARLALVHHCLRWAGHDKTVGQQIDEESIAAGIELSRWFGNEAKRVYSILAESEEEQEARTLAEVVRAKGGSVSVRDWQKLRGHQSSELAEVELGGLVKAEHGDWVFAEIGPQGGRPSKRFVLRHEAPETETPNRDDAEGVSSEFQSDASNGSEGHQGNTDPSASPDASAKPGDADRQPPPGGTREEADWDREGTRPLHSDPPWDSDRTPAGDAGLGVSDSDLDAQPPSPAQGTETGEMFRDEDSTSWGVHDA